MTACVEVGFRGGWCVRDAVFDLLQFGPGLLERFEANDGAVFDAGPLLAQIAPAVHVRGDPLQLLGGLVRGGGKLLGLFRLAFGQATDRGCLPP